MAKMTLLNADGTYSASWLGGATLFQCEDAPNGRLRGGPRAQSAVDVLWGTGICLDLRTADRLAGFFGNGGEVAGVRPEGAWHTSPGQRPGSASHPTSPSPERAWMVSSGCH